ncbi:RDD family protein [Colwellia sp. BRX10-3]|nr:RDD family protein [Colwellia sp. BRX10-3]
MDEPIQYVGFWPRVIASLIDTVILFMLTSPILYLIYGGEYFDSYGATHGLTDFIISYLLPIAAVILFWIYKSATPGKMAISAKIVDGNTGGKPTTKQYIIRYLSYYVSLFALGLGFFWIAWDEKKQGWHDKIAGTVVIHRR